VPIRSVDPSCDELCVWRDSAENQDYETDCNCLLEIGWQDVGLPPSAPFILEHLRQDHVRVPLLERVTVVL
jgi:hypothetical protein